MNCQSQQKSEKQVCVISSSKSSSNQLQQGSNQDEIASPSNKITSDLNESQGQQDGLSPQYLKADKFYLYLNQVGGHSTFLKPVDDRINFIVKPVQRKELEFYESLEKTKNMNKLRQFLPKYYGTVEISNSTQILVNNSRSVQEKSSSENLQYMKLQDLTKNKKFPCILDIKMGFKATSKKDELKFESSTSSQVGFRICGMNVYQPLKKCAIFKNKYWGRAIQQESLQSSVASFFYDGEQIRFGLIHKFIKQLKELKKALQYYKGYKFNSSSLLLIYDGIYTADQFKIQEKIKTKEKTSIKNSQINTPYSYSLNSNKRDKIKNLNAKKIKIQENKEFKYQEPVQFALENNSSDKQIHYKPLLLQNRRKSAFQQNFNSIQQQISNFSDVDKKNLSKNKSYLLNNMENKNKSIMKYQSESKENGLSQLDLIDLVNQISTISRARSDSSDSSESSISGKNGSMEGYSQYEEEEEQNNSSSSDSSDQHNHSFMSQGSNGNCKSNASFNQGKEVGESLNKSLISSHSQECFTFRQSRPRSILKLIDFANIEINENLEECDQELVKGIDNLIELLMNITQKEVSASFVIQNQQLFYQNEGEQQQIKRRSSFSTDPILEGINFITSNNNSISNESTYKNQN